MRKFRLVLQSAAVILLFLTGVVLADGIIIPRPIPSKPVPPYLTIKYHRVKVDINNQVATTTVDQVFINRMNSDLEGDYVFPLPEGAVITSFQMEVDGQMVEGKILDKDKAREIYEGIVRQRKDPALLEYVGRNMFRARVYPIPARGEKRVVLKYTETLSASDGVVKYLYPLNTEKFSPEPLKDVSVSVRINSKVPIKSVYSPSHPMAITRKSEHLASASYEKANTTPKEDVVLYYTLSDREFGLNLLTFKHKGEDGYFMMFLAPHQKTDKNKVLPKDVIFVLDKSGSMDEKGKMENAQKALKFCLSNLNSVDNFNLIVFSDEVESFSSGLIPATKENVARARQFVDNTRPLGGTNIQDSLMKAMGMLKQCRNTPYVIFLTDGLPTVGETNVSNIISSVNKANVQKVRLFTFGVGYDVNTRLLDSLANENRGFPEYIKPKEDMEVKVSGFYKKIAEPLLSDVELYIEGVKTYSIYPKQLPDLFKGTQLVVLGRYRGESKGKVILKGRRGKDSFNAAYAADFTSSAADSDFIRGLWAMRRIGYLLEAIRGSGEKKELVDEIVHLSKEFGIITPYTSFLVTEPTDADRARFEDKPAPVMSAPSKPVFSAGAKRESGEESVSTSQNINAYKQQAQVPMEADLGEGRKKDIREIVKRMEGKTFFLRDGVWTDSLYKGTEKIVNVKFGTKEYFKLASDKKMARFLSLGDKVLVCYQGVVYLVKP